jgi:hypothetical protein
MPTKNLLELARLEELTRLVHQEQAIAELLDVLKFNFEWLIRFCETNHIDIPDRERLFQSEQRIRVLLREIASDESYHQDESDAELPEPKRGTLLYQKRLLDPCTLGLTCGHGGD